MVPWEGANVLYKYGIGWIILKVIFKGRNGQIWQFFFLWGNFLKNCLITFSLFCHEGSQGGCWISQGLIKVKSGYFATFWQFSQKRSDNFSLFCMQQGDDIDQLSRDEFETNLVLKYESCGITLKGHFQGQNCQIWALMIYLI